MTSKKSKKKTPEGVPAADDIIYRLNNWFGDASMQHISTCNYIICSSHSIVKAFCENF